MKRMLMIAAGCAAMVAGAAEPEMAQQIALKKGWNSVYLRVGPSASADELFASWPVRWVALYSPTDYLDTRQFSDTGDAEGAKTSGYRIWRRGDAWASTLRSVPANSVLVAFATNVWSGAFHGVPQAPRISWHDSLAQGTMNLVGFSVYDETITDTYFSGLSVGDGPFYVFGGTNANAPQIMPTTMAGAKKYTDGEVLLVDSKKTSDWSGVLNVSPAKGLDFGTESSRSMLEVRNDGATAREVSVTMFACKGFDGGEPPRTPDLHWRDTVAVSNGAWAALLPDAPIRKTLAAGETWRIEVAVDRSKFGGDLPAGTVYGAILRARDESEPVYNARNVLEGGSRMQAFVPVRAEIGGGGGGQVLPWPFGLWMTVAELDTVTFMISKDDSAEAVKTGDLPSGGKMKVRLPLYVDDHGDMTMLQRFWFGRNTNGVLRVFSGAVEKSDEPLTEVKRVSTPFLPTDQVEIPIPHEAATFYRDTVVTNREITTIDVTEFGGWHATYVLTNYVVVATTVVDKVIANTFGVSAMAPFTVGEDSKVNPFRHAQHPQHDGLTADYLRPTPSGDDISNYLGGTKPEAFSVTNRVYFLWDEGTATTWNPEETLTGNLQWEFDGLRKEGTVRAKGRFTMKLLTRAPVKLRED